MNIKELKKKILIYLLEDRNYNEIVGSIVPEIKKYRSENGKGKKLNDFLLLLDHHFELHGDDNRQEVAIELMNRMVGYCGRDYALVFEDIYDYALTLEDLDHTTKLLQSKQLPPPDIE